MKNYVQEGEVITLIAPYARLAGEGAKVANIFGVAINDMRSPLPASSPLKACSTSRRYPPT